LRGDFRPALLAVRRVADAPRAFRSGFAARTLVLFAFGFVDRFLVAELFFFADADADFAFRVKVEATPRPKFCLPAGGLDASNAADHQRDRCQEKPYPVKAAANPLR